MARIRGGGGGAAPLPPDPWAFPYEDEPSLVPPPPPPYQPPYVPGPQLRDWGSSSDRGRGQPAPPPPPPPFAGWPALPTTFSAPLRDFGAPPAYHPAALAQMQQRQAYGLGDPYARNYYEDAGAAAPWMREGQRTPWVPTLAQAEQFYGGWGATGRPSPYGPGIGPPTPYEVPGQAPPPGMNRWVTPRGVVWLPPGQDPSGGFAPPGGGAAEQPVAQQPWGPGAGGPGGGGGRDGGGEGGTETPETEGLGEYRPVYAPFSEEGGTVAVLQPDDYMSLPEFVRPYLGQILEKLGWKAELIGQWGPYRFTRMDAWRMWITEADMAWITDYRVKQWLLAFFSAKGWGEAMPWPPKIEEPPTH